MLKLRVRLLCTCAALAAPSGLAHAQVVEAGQEAAAANRDVVIVTATKREEDLQEVPAAISSFSQEELERTGVHDIRDLPGLSASLNVGVTASDAVGVNVRIRNIGTNAINPGLETSVGVVVDGVPRSRASVGLADIPGIERIEVLRGPQGTLFGKNTSAGVVHVITAAPDFAPEVTASASFGNYASQEYQASLNGPLIAEVLAGRLDATYIRRDGFVDDATDDRVYRDKDRYAIRAQALWEINDDATFRFIGDYASIDEAAADIGVYSILSQSFLDLAQLVGAPTPTIGMDPFEVSLSPARNPNIQTDQWGLSGELSWDLSWATLTSITGYRDYRSSQGRDIDVGPVDIAYVPENGSTQLFKTFSQEVRLQGEADRLDWLVGAFLFQEELETEFAFRFGADWVPYWNAQLSGLVPTFQGMGACMFPGTGYFQQCTGLAGSAAAPEGAGRALRHTGRTLTALHCSPTTRFI